MPAGSSLFRATFTAATAGRVSIFYTADSRCRVWLDGVMLADISGEEVENYMLANNKVHMDYVKAYTNASYLINPGFVETPATASNTFAMPGLISAERAADEILQGIAQGRFHIHFPKRFTNWMRFAQLLPYRLYFPLIHKVTGL
mgnify:CR=1 FL=1